VCVQVLIVSYETFRTHAARFGGARADSSCDLLICDEVLNSSQCFTTLHIAQFCLRKKDVVFVI
jgi:hypothetical protein